MSDNRQKLLNAWTPTEYSGIFPEYVTVMQEGGGVRVSIRGPIKKDGSPGDFITFKTNVWTVHKIGQVLIDASENFDTGA